MDCREPSATPGLVELREMPDHEVPMERREHQWVTVETLPSGKLPIEWQKIAKNLTFFFLIDKNCHFFQQNCHWQFCWKIWQFLSIKKKKVKFLAIFWHSSGNFLEGQVGIIKPGQNCQIYSTTHKIQTPQRQTPVWWCRVRGRRVIGWPASGMSWGRGTTQPCVCPGGHQTLPELCPSSSWSGWCPGLSLCQTRGSRLGCELGTSGHGRY